MVNMPTFGRARRGIRQYLLIASHHDQIALAGCRDDDPIGWIVRRRTGQAA